MNPEKDVPNPLDSEDKAKLARFYSEYSSKHKELLESDPLLKASIEYLVDMAPEEALDGIMEEAKSGPNLSEWKSLIKDFMEKVKDALKHSLIEDERLAKVLEGRIIRMEMYLAVIE